jgi:uncharacterized protein YkwD
MDRDGTRAARIRRRWGVLTWLVAGAAVLAMVTEPSPASATTTARPLRPVPSAGAPKESWLDIVNGYRRQAGLVPVTADPKGAAGARASSCYMIRNDIAHDQIKGLPGYTRAGAAAAQASNLAVSAEARTPDRRMIDLWMTGPFHAIGILRPNLRTVAYGRCEGTGPLWRTAATLNVLDGLVPAPRPATPVVWPGNNTTTHLSTFVAERPNPVELCGWSGTAGLPVIAMLPGTVPGPPTAAMTAPNRKGLEVCALWHGNVDDPAARTILGGQNAVVVVPRKPLTAGRHTVVIVSGSQTIEWSFTIRP